MGSEDSEIEMLYTPRRRTEMDKIDKIFEAYKAQIKDLSDLLDSCGREGKKVLAENYKLLALNAGLLEALKSTRWFVSQPTPLSKEIDELIAKAEALK